MDDTKPYIAITCDNCEETYPDEKWFCKACGYEEPVTEWEDIVLNEMEWDYTGNGMDERQVTRYMEYSICVNCCVCHKK